jgi:uncharacterized membrane protein
MRRPVGGRLLGATLLAAALALGACGREKSGPAENNPDSPEAARQAQMAAESLAVLGDAASPQVRALYTGDFQASGQLDALGAGEGAWELRLMNDYAQFVRPGLGQDGGLPGERDYRERGMRVAAGPLTITLRAEECTLPSEVKLPYTAQVLFEGVAYQGCARRGLPEGERASWASVLNELLPAIDACLARVSSRPARVTTASAREENMVSVRIREADGTRRECIASADGASAPTYELLSPLDHTTGEGDPEFVRAEEAPRARDCTTVEEVFDSEGGHVGWLIYSSC